jgi:hypothetical protein
VGRALDLGDGFSVFEGGLSKEQLVPKGLAPGFFAGLAFAFEGGILGSNRSTPSSRIGPSSCTIRWFAWPISKTRIGNS